LIILDHQIFRYVILKDNHPKDAGVKKWKIKLEL